MNRIELSAQIMERLPMRYTPAGLPALDVRLSHASRQEHLGQMRQVDLEIHATGIGETALQLERLAVGSTVQVTGFLARQRNGRGVMLHIIELDSRSNVPDSF
ncbi:restart primosome assembly protein PriB [Sphaerotilus hippei]|uniref:Replication restart protein PriB n=1 Tax=Sphaerotilus hippei TaxID=744406 RepID=A0A318H4P8_9BURK|nr:primosomal replication protein N [Sphaerotilus hippei]PXW98666.1 restart primosome assembly protein PriB [Sphaerotilus hippei]